MAKRRPLAGLAATSILILALLDAVLWTMRPQTVDAQEILAKAQATATDAAAGGVKGFVLTEVTRSRRTARAEAEAGNTDSGRDAGQRMTNEARAATSEGDIAEGSEGSVAPRRNRRGRFI